MSVFRDLMWFFKQEKKSYGIGILVLLFVAILNLFPPYVIRIFVDGIESGDLTKDRVVLWGLLLLGSGLICYGLRYVWRLMLYGAAARLGRLLRNRLFVHFTKLSPEFYHQKRTGDLMAHATNDIEAVEATAGDGVLTLVDSITTGGLVVLSMAVFIDWKLTLISLLPMPIMAWSTSYYGKLLHQRFGQAQAAFSDLNDKVQENISGVKVIKAFGLEEKEKKEFKNLSASVVERNMAVAKVDALFDPTIMVIVGLCYFLAISAGSYFVIEERITIGQLTQFTVYLGQFIWPMLAFGWLFNITERGRASYDRIQALLAVEPAVKDREGAISCKLKGDVVYRINSFTYPGKSEPVLKNISFHLPEGKTLGVVGKTGSGKTTLLRLLMREFDCNDGDISIGGRSIYGCTLESLRQTLGYVPQDHFLFSTTIAENVAYGRSDAGMEEIEEVCRIACIHDDIMGFKDQYQTIVGDRGVTLSGGQKQRIAIARALLIEPEILVLDDSLSAVDGKTEKMILKALKEKRKNRTLIISAHRLSAVEHADLILVLDEGTVIEQGTHAELMEKGGWYAATYRRQQLESLIEEGGC